MVVVFRAFTRLSRQMTTVFAVMVFLASAGAFFAAGIFAVLLQVTNVLLYSIVKMSFGQYNFHIFQQTF